MHDICHVVIHEVEWWLWSGSASVRWYTDLKIMASKRRENPRKKAKKKIAVGFSVIGIWCYVWTWLASIYQLRLVEGRWSREIPMWSPCNIVEGGRMERNESATLNWCTEQNHIHAVTAVGRSNLTQVVEWSKWTLPISIYRVPRFVPILWLLYVQ